MYSDGKDGFPDGFLGQVKTVYTGAKGVVKFQCGHNAKGVKISASLMEEERYIHKYIVRSAYLDNQMLKMSACTFHGKAHCDMKHAKTVCALAVDLAPSIHYEGHFSWVDFIRKLNEHNAVADVTGEGFLIPMPTYVEVSPKIRLVYVLKEPVFLPYRDKKKRTATIIWIQRILSELCRKLETVEEVYAFPVKLNGFLLAHGSKRVKWIGCYNRELKKQEFHELKDSRFYVRTYPINWGKVGKWREAKQWEIHELSDAVLPPLQDWYEKWKEKGDRVKPGIHISGTKRTPRELAYFRLELLSKLQKNGYDVGFREHMCFLFWNFAYQAGFDDGLARKMTQAFNRQFETPMDDAEMVSRAAPSKQYRYKNSTLIEFLKIPAKLADGLGLFVYDKTRYMREYMRQYRAQKNPGRKPKVSLREKIASKAQKLRREHLTISAIASKLGVSESTVKRSLAVPT